MTLLEKEEFDQYTLKIKNENGILNLAPFKSMSLTSINNKLRLR